MISIVKDLRKKEDELINLDIIKEYSTKLHYNIRDVMNYLISQGYIMEVFKDLFYVKNNDEFNKKELKYSRYELITKVLMLKKVKNWYFGLNTALTFESTEKKELFFDNDKSIDYIINDRLSMNKPITIDGNKFSFFVFNNELLTFGIKTSENYRYSDLEKTILDYIYIYSSNHVGIGKIMKEASKYKNHVSKERIFEFSKHYPSIVGQILEKANFY